MLASSPAKPGRGVSGLKAGMALGYVPIAMIKPRMAEAMVTSAKTSFHWEKVLLEVKTVDVFSYRLQGFRVHAFVSHLGTEGMP